MPSFLFKVRKIVAVLLIAVLVGLPVFDVLACGFEDTAVHATSEGAADSHDEGDDSQQHGTCAHNHCHHAGASILQDMAMPSLQVKRLLPTSGNEALHPTSTLVDGPMRPPQA